LVLQGLRI